MEARGPRSFRERERARERESESERASERERARESESEGERARERRDRLAVRTTVVGAKYILFVRCPARARSLNDWCVRSRSPGKVPSRFVREVLAKLDGASDGAFTYANESNAGGPALWGCRPTAKQRVTATPLELCRKRKRERERERSL